MTAHTEAPRLEQPIAFLATANANAARDFYENRLGLPFVGDEPFALVFRMGRSELRIQKVEAISPASHTVLGWHVVDIEAAVAALGARGIAFERYPPLPQDEHGIWTAPGGAQIAWFRDPDGNTLSLTSHPRNEPAFVPR